jgi:hypothetical protein
MDLVLLGTLSRAPGLTDTQSVLALHSTELLLLRTSHHFTAIHLTIFPSYSVTDRTFLTVCANTASKCIMAHIRAASRPPVVPTNNHPFVFGRHSFMHNGTVTFFPEIVSLIF